MVYDWAGGWLAAFSSVPKEALVHMEDKDIEPKWDTFFMHGISFLKTLFLPSNGGGVRLHLLESEYALLNNPWLPFTPIHKYQGVIRENKLILHCMGKHCMAIHCMYELAGAETSLSLWDTISRLLVVFSAILQDSNGFDWWMDGWDLRMPPAPQNENKIWQNKTCQQIIPPLYNNMMMKNRYSW